MARSAKKKRMEKNEERRRPATNQMCNEERGGNYILGTSPIYSQRQQPRSWRLMLSSSGPMAVPTATRRLTSMVRSTVRTLGACECLEWSLDRLDRGI